ncbi:MAG: FAD-dependent oxidoreductase [Hyphomicrobiaceae bacterium]
MTLRIAVVGAGISGLGAAWLLSRRHDVTLFEREARPGGHSHTIEVDAPEGGVPVDTGFIVYNPPAYPNLVALFAHLGVETAPTAMTFSVSLDGGAYEYAGSARGFFGQPANLARPGHWRVLADTLRFFREARAIACESGEEISLGAFLHERGFSPEFRDHHILPMAAAIWSATPSAMLTYPLAAFTRFFANHGLLQVRGRPQWRTVVGGSRAYVVRLLADFPGQVRLGASVTGIERHPRGVTVRLAGGPSEIFDHCVLATHADTALGLIGDADGTERDLLSPFRYTENEAVLHTDAAAMPRRRGLWASWNFIGRRQIGDTAPSVTYWMNSLQPLATGQNYFVSLNPMVPLAARHVIRTMSYAHPLFDQAAMRAQKRLWVLQGRRRTWFCGSYFGAGFHEDGLQAGLAVAEALGGVERPWQVAAPSGRIHVLSGATRPVVAEEVV